VNAWPSLRDALDLLVTVPDAAAAQGMRRLADAGLDVGECGATALAALITHGSGLLAAAGVGSGACVLSLITEGPTDPDSFERVVGRPPRSTVRHVA
jgi:diaminopropionate ammonia-lyase